MGNSVAYQMGDYAYSFRKAKFWKEGEKACDDEEDITDKVIIVTGSNQGIGKSISEELAKRGAKVIMAVRSVQKGKEAAEDIKRRVGEAKLEVMRLDLGELQSIREFVEEFNAKFSHLDVLINNAGIMDTSETLQKTKDGNELQMGTNYLGPYLLTSLLLDSLKRAEPPGKIISVSSMVIASSPFELDDWMQEKKVKKGRNGVRQYAFSKLCCSIAMLKIAKRLEGSGVKVFQLDPGWVKTNMSEVSAVENKNLAMKKVMKGMAKLIGISPHEASETPVYLVVSREIAEEEKAGKGELYRFKKVWNLGNGVVEKFEAEEKADELIKLTVEIIGLGKD